MRIITYPEKCPSGSATSVNVKNEVMTKKGTFRDSRQEMWKWYQAKRIPFVFQISALENVCQSLINFIIQNLKILGTK